MMIDDEIIEVLKEFDSNRIEKLSENTQKLFYAIMKIVAERDELRQENDIILSLLTKEYGPPCELDGFMDKNVDYCSRNCGVDEEIYKNCWRKYINQNIKEKE